MKIQGFLLAGLAAWTAFPAQAANKDYTVKYRQAIYEDGRLLHEKRRQPYGFRVEVISDQEGVKREGVRFGSPFVTAKKGERYSVRLYNPLPVRVAVNLTVDGLNSISGKPCGISDGQKWVIEPYSSVTIPGWQVNGGESRRFFFTDKPKSYAKWQGDNLDRDLAANCGVIGAAYFWDQRELDRYYDERPLTRNTYRPYPYSSSQEMESRSSVGKAAAGAPAANRDLGERKKEASRDDRPEEAGTGMGERHSHPTIQVNFDYNTGMYKLSQALVIRYGFEEKPVPHPFPEMGYAPEMN